MDSSESFGHWVKRRRKALDLTQADLAQRVGCAEITIRKIEADEIRPSRQFVARLAGQLGIEPAQRAAFIASGRRMPQRRFNNLLAPPNLLIGREREVAAVCERLRHPGVRLLTLTGPGGVGKTRLGLQAAGELLDDFADGVCFVALAPLNDPGLVGSSIAQALDLDPSSGRAPDEHLISYLRDRQMLLVLDNFEQVAGAASSIAALLAHAARLKLLVTSRVLLHLSGEHELPVPPLELPNVQRLPPVQALSEYAAIALFVDRAQAARPDFALTSANATAVAEICARLDGLPLAIELAAARIKLLSPEALLARLVGANHDSPLNLLTGGPYDLPERQQTLRSAIAWSYDLLNPSEQLLFRRLGVFVAGCTPSAAEAVCGMEDGGWRIEDRSILHPPSSIFDVLASLVNKSLLRHEEALAGEVRFVMLETLREYAIEQLAASGELEALRRQHAAYYLALAEAARPHLQDTQQESWLERLEAEHGNLRAALDWSRAPSGDAAVGLRLAQALWEFWLVRGYVSEGRAWIAAVLALPAASRPSLTRARVLGGGGRLAWAQNDWGQATALLEASRELCEALGDSAGSAGTLLHLGQVAEAQGVYPRAAALFERSLALFEQLGDREGSAQALTSHGQIAQAQGDYELALALLERSLALFQELGDRRGYAAALTVQGQVRHGQGDYSRAEALFAESLALFQNLGYRHGMGWALTNQGQAVLEQGDHARAWRLFTHSLALFQELGDRRGYAWALANQGHTAQEQGDYERAAPLLEASLALFQELGDRRGYAWALIYRGHIAQAQGAYEQAARYFAESLTIFRALGDAWFSTECLAGLAVACAVLGRPEAAARLFAAAGSIREASHIQGRSTGHAGSIAAARASLGDASFAAASAQGRAMTLEQASSYALEQARRACQVESAKGVPSGPEDTRSL